MGKYKGYSDEQKAEEFASMLHYVAECIRYAIAVNKQHNCNDCGKKGCEHKPEPGSWVRINCFEWERRESPWIKESGK